MFVHELLSVQGEILREALEALASRGASVTGGLGPTAFETIDTSLGGLPPKGGARGGATGPDYGKR